MISIAYKKEKEKGNMIVFRPTDVPGFEKVLNFICD